MWLPDGLKASARRYPDRVAVCSRSKAVTFAELEAQSDAIRANFLESRVEPGDRIGILADRSVEAIVLFWAALRAGAIVVHLNDQLRPGTIRQILMDCKPKLVFATRHSFNQKLARLVDNLDRCAVVVFDDAMQYETLSCAPALSKPEIKGTDGDIAAIVYTSGSTGSPKGVCLSHRNLFFVARGEIEHTPITHSDSYLMIVPLHFIHGLMELLVHNLAGATVHLSEGFVLPRTVIKELAETGATGVSGVPYHFAALMDRGGFLDTVLAALKWIGITGGKISAERIRRIREAKPDLRIHILYGQTECGPRITALPPKKVDRKPSSVGAPYDGVEVTVLNDQGDPVPTGQVGEVAVRGENVMVGYWQQPEATAEVIDGLGRLRTGDLGCLDNDGDLFLEGRKDEMIKSAGERIFPQELEELLLQYEEVVQAAVIGVPDPLYGERVEAHLVVCPLPSESQERQRTIDRIRGYCLDQVPFARAPHTYHLWNELPRRPNGKPDRQTLARCPQTQGIME